MATYDPTSGALTLLEANKYSDDVMKRGVVETLIQESPILEQLPFTPLAGNAIKIEVEATLPDVEFRKVNEQYNRSSGTDTERYFGVAILGGEVFIDNFIVKVKGNRVRAKARQFAKFSKSMSRTFDKYFFDGTGTADDFMGINQLIEEGLGQKLAMDTNGAPLALDAMDEAKDLLRGQSSPDAWLINRFIRRKVTSLARTTHSGISLIDVGTDVFGRQVNMYDGVPMRIIGDDKDGNAILAFDETQGSSNVTASIYAIAYGEDENVAGLAGAGGSLEVKDFGETEAAPGHLGRVEWYPGLAIYNPYSVVRIHGITEA